jgi:hypothetical protein
MATPITSAGRFSVASRDEKISDLNIGDLAT